MQVKKLKDIVEFLDNKRKPLNNVEREKMKGSIPYYGTNGIVDYVNDFIFDEPLILLAEDGGHFGSKTKPIAYKIEGKTWVNNHAHVLKPKNGYDIDFLKWSLSFYDVTKYTTGSTRIKLTKGDAERMEFKIPDLKTQQDIAQVLEQTDKARQQRKAANALTDQFLQSSFLSLFGDPVKNEKRWELDTVRKLASKYSDGPFGSNLKSEHYTQEGVRIIRLQNIGVNEFKNDAFAFVSTKHYETLKKHSCYPGDVLIGTMGEPNLRACILPDFIDVAINKADCVLFRPNLKRVLSEYISYLLNIPSYVESVSNLVLGQTRGRISMGRLANAQLPVPPLSLQQQFAGIVAQAEQLRQKQMESERELENLFQGLLQRYFG